jgi:hypothetical protein
LGQRAALYCRVSTADQSCARQERDLVAFAARAGYEVVGVFRETGSGAKLDRAERKKVMALAQRREIDAVLVTELSRWGRSTLDLLHTLKELETWRVSVITMNGLAFELATPHGRMMATTVTLREANAGVELAYPTQPNTGIGRKAPPLNPCQRDPAHAAARLRLALTDQGPIPVSFRIIWGTAASRTLSDTRWST